MQKIEQAWVRVRGRVRVRVRGRVRARVRARVRVRVRQAGLHAEDRAGDP